MFSKKLNLKRHGASYKQETVSREDHSQNIWEKLKSFKLREKLKYKILKISRYFVIS